MTYLALSLIGWLVATGPTQPGFQIAPDDLQGTWEITYMEDDEGRSLSKSWCKDHLLIVKGDRLAWRQEGRVWSEARFQVNVSSHPGQMNIAFISGGFEGKMLPAIYKVEGDLLCICRGEKTRPQGFARNAGNHQSLLICKRAKPK